jgi:acyl carrier protein
MPTFEQVKTLLGTTLGIPTKDMTQDSGLLGNVPELDSMAVLGLITAIEERFAVSVDDDEISSRHFETVGTLTAFVQHKLNQCAARG